MTVGRIAFNLTSDGTVDVLVEVSPAVVWGMNMVVGALILLAAERGKANSK